MTCTMLVGNAYSFFSAAFGWLCSRPDSLLARWSRPLLVLLNAGRCECLYHDLALLLFAGDGLVSYLRISRQSLRYLHCQGRWVSFSCRIQSGAFLACYLVASSPRLCLFSTWARRLSFSCCKCSARSYYSIIFVTCSSCLFSIS